MTVINCGIAALAVAVIFYIWRGYALFLWRKQRVLRSRVAYMLWVMADRATERE
jgi:hypothetical protein